jgi:rhodanese-related sulfurtransferase
MHIPLEQLTRRLGELPADRHIVTVCRSGYRSAIASGLLRGEGRSASDLAGGMNAWADAGLPTVPDSGTPGHVA